MQNRGRFCMEGCGGVMGTPHHMAKIWLWFKTQWHIGETSRVATLTVWNAPHVVQLSRRRHIAVAPFV